MRHGCRQTGRDMSKSTWLIRGVNYYIDHPNDYKYSLIFSMVVMMAAITLVDCSSTPVVVLGNNSAQQVTALWVFGDSLVDNGNNNYINSLARSNYYPYGIDYINRLPTGRFSNGKNFLDYLADLLGVASPPPFADPSTSGARIIGGVNYASAAGGILDETGRHYVCCNRSFLPLSLLH